MRTLNLWGMERRILRVPVIIASFSFLVASFADIVLEGQDSRRLAPSTKIGCSYRDGRYEHGEPVQTPEPCLNCTCTRGVLVCYLRVCPTLVPPSSDCFAVKEADDCCATMICNNIHRGKANESVAAKTHFSGRTLTNSIPVYRKAEVVASNHRPSAESTSTTRGAYTVEPPRNDGVPRNFTPSGSLLFISSTPAPFEKNLDILFNSITGCYVNGTIYAEGSAMISSSFCEYCYCIRGKQMCVRPKCHLSIEGCSPRYFSQYTCCPTRYMCNEKRKIYRLTSSSTTTTMATTTRTEPTTHFTSSVQPPGCLVKGITYSIGDPIPSTAHCQTCFCSEKGVICTSVTCSPAMDGCEPVIPEGHCCPLEFKCNFTQTPPSDVQESTIKMNKENNSFITNNILGTTTSYPLSGGSASKAKEEMKENRKTAQSGKTESVIDSSNLSPAVMRENDRVIYFPEFAGNLRRRISEVASLVGYSTKQSNKGPFHSFRPPVVYKKENERGTYFSKQGDGLIPRRATGRGRTDFGSEDVHLAETDTEILAASANLRITNANYGKRGSPAPNNFTSEYSITTVPHDDFSTKSIETSDKPKSTDFTQGSIKIYTPQTGKVPDRTTVDIIPTAISVEELTRNSTSDFWEDFTNSEISNSARSKSTIEKTATFETSDNVTITTLSNDYYINSTKIIPDVNGSKDISIPTTVKPEQEIVHIAETTAMADEHSSIIKDNSTIAVLPQDLSQDTEFPLSENVSYVTISPLSEEINSNTNSHLLEESVIVPTVTDVDNNMSSSSIYSNSSSHSSSRGINVTMDSVSANDSSVLNDYSAFLKPTLPEQQNLTTDTTLPSNSEDNYSVIESRNETSKGIWYSEPGLTTVTSYDDSVSSSSKLDDKKRPRQKNETPRFSNSMRIIPFLAKDAITSGPYTWPIRNRTQASTKPPAEVIIGHCVVNGRVHINGEMIGSSDPCSLCRCFYGKALCQQQQCPHPPSSDCIPEHSPDFCCPRYICGKGLTDAPEIHYSSQMQFTQHTLASETSQPSLHAEKILPTDTSHLIASSTSQYIDSKYDVKEESIQQNKNRTFETFEFYTDSSTINSRTIESISTTSQSNIKDTEERVNQESLSTTESIEPHPEGIKSEFWALLRVSGCNIYGHYYQVDERITELSEQCKECVCTRDGVKCSDIC